MYLYTGTIEFAPFGSEENRRSRSTEIIDSSPNEVPRPSPKSIYRLADKVCVLRHKGSGANKFPPQYDIPALKSLALNHIRRQLAKCDIVEESFTRFASRQVRHIVTAKCAHAAVKIR